jgi:hypothetical protein
MVGDLLTIRFAYRTRTLFFERYTFVRYAYFIQGVRTHRAMNGPIGKVSGLPPLHHTRYDYTGSRCNILPTGN